MTVPRAQRFRILARDGFACRYCGRRPPSAVLEVDHVVPRSRGGSDADKNLVAACFDCNRGKRATPLPTTVEALRRQRTRSRTAVSLLILDALGQMGELEAEQESRIWLIGQCENVAPFDAYDMLIATRAWARETPSPRETGQAYITRLLLAYHRNSRVKRA